jgi:hypothetical protein
LSQRWQGGCCLHLWWAPPSYISAGQTPPQLECVPVPHPHAKWFIRHHSSICIDTLSLLCSCLLLCGSDAGVVGHWLSELKLASHSFCIHCICTLLFLCPCLSKPFTRNKLEICNPVALDLLAQLSAIINWLCLFHPCIIHYGCFPKPWFQLQP